MIIEFGGVKILADAITAVVIDEKNSGVYTTGGMIAVTQPAAKAIAEAWEEFDEGIIETEEVDEDEE